jgi:hypothetical protein
VVPAFPLWVVGVSYVLLIALTMRVYRVSPPVLRIAIET